MVETKLSTEVTGLCAVEAINRQEANVPVPHPLALEQGHATPQTSQRLALRQQVARLPQQRVAALPWSAVEIFSSISPRFESEQGAQCGQSGFAGMYISADSNIITDPCKKR